MTLVLTKLGRSRVAALWLVVALGLFAASGSLWRDLVSKPAGTIVHVSVTGGNLIPMLKALAFAALLISLVSFFASRLVVLILSVMIGIFSLVALVETISKLGPGDRQVGVSVHVFPLPAAVALLGILSALALSVSTPLSARGWAIARYRASESPKEATSLDMWRAQDSGEDPTQDERAKQ
ncbi:MAG TPA: Trp biosynthesis-associated membrane protein [Candidatus Nanopelagicaceae bacterium]|nr:Trp biosynthesis-associated membrane protein [Candidatus Nanopelagicaceae bacterium]